MPLTTTLTKQHRNKSKLQRKKDIFPSNKNDDHFIAINDNICFRFFPPFFKYEKTRFGCEAGILLTPIFDYENLRNPFPPLVYLYEYLPLFKIQFRYFFFSLRLFCDITTSIVTVLLQLLKGNPPWKPHTMTRIFV